MTPIIIKIIAGVISTIGFAIIFRLKPSHWAFAAIDGLLACFFFFLFTDLIGGNFWPNALAALITAFMAEMFARISKAPSTIFLLPGCIALVPGGSLYYSMNNLISANYTEAAQYLLTTIEVGIAIGGGIIVASILRMGIFKFVEGVKDRI